MRSNRSSSAATDRYRDRSNAAAVGVVTFLVGAGLAAWTAFWVAVVTVL